jgi:hypothetical protein
LIDCLKKLDYIIYCLPADKFSAEAYFYSAIFSQKCSIYSDS